MGAFTHLLILVAGLVMVCTHVSKGSSMITTSDGTEMSVPHPCEENGYSGYAESVIYHMERDLSENKSILLADGPRLRQTEIRFSNDKCVHNQNFKDIAGKKHDGYKDTYGQFCEQIEECCRNCPFGTCKGNNKCDSSNYNYGKDATEFMKITGFTQLSPNHIVIVDNGNNCLRLLHRPSSYTYPYLGLCNNDVKGLTNAMKRHQVRFNSPWSILQVPNSKDLMVTDSGNDALRVIKVDPVTYQPLLTQTLNHAILHNPTGMSWSPDNTELLISNFHYISKLKVDEFGKLEQSLVAGTALPADSEGAFRNASFEQPIEITHITETLVVVADFFNCKLKIMDLFTQNVTTIKIGSTYGCYMAPVSLLMMDDHLLIGGLKKLYSVPVNRSDQNKPSSLNNGGLVRLFEDDSLLGSRSPHESNQEYKWAVNNKNSTADVCPGSIHEVADPITGKALVKLPMAARIIQTMELPVGNYSYNIMFDDHHGETDNCSLAVTIYDHRIRRRVDFSAVYDVDCQLLQRSEIETVVTATMNQSYPQINEICDGGCSTSADTEPYMNCTNNMLTITWPTNVTYNGSVVSIPDQLQSTVTKQLSCRKTVMPLLILDQPPRMVYPQKANNESGITFSLTSYCQDKDGGFTSLNDMNIPSCSQSSV